MGKFADEFMSKFPDSDIPQLADFKRFTVAWVIQRVIEDVKDNPELKQIGQSKLYILQALQRSYLGEKDARKLTRQDIIEFAKWLRKRVCASTVLQHIGYLAVTLDHANSTWEDCADITRAPIGAAGPYLRKHSLVGKGTARTQRPSVEQIEALKARARKQAANHKHAEIARRMPDLLDAARISARRLGELCRIVEADVDYEGGTYWVRDLKHPTKKKGNDKQFILWPELAAIFKRQPKSPDGRIFAIRAASASAWHTHAKKPGAATPEGLGDIRFHDNRGDAISAWLLKGLTKDQVRKLVTGHETDKQIDATYDRREIGEMMALVPPELLSGLKALLPQAST